MLNKIDSVKRILLNEGVKSYYNDELSNEAFEVSLRLKNGTVIIIHDFVYDQIFSKNRCYTVFVEGPNYGENLILSENDCNCFFDLTANQYSNVLRGFDDDYIKEKVGVFFKELNEDEKQDLFFDLIGYGCKDINFEDYFYVQGYDFKIKDKNEVNEEYYDFVKYFYEDKYCVPKFIPSFIFTEKYKSEEEYASAWIQDCSADTAYIKCCGVENLYHIIQHNNN